MQCPCMWFSPNCLSVWSAKFLALWQVLDCFHCLQYPQVPPTGHADPQLNSFLKEALYIHS